MKNAAARPGTVGAGRLAVYGIYAGIFD